MSLETREMKPFWWDIPGFCWDIPGVPEQFEENKFVFDSRPLDRKTVQRGRDGYSPSNGLACSDSGTSQNTADWRLSAYICPLSSAALKKEALKGCFDALWFVLAQKTVPGRVRVKFAQNGGHEKATKKPRKKHEKVTKKARTLCF